MALVVGDIHGRIDKAKMFLEYKPEEIHVFSGDYVDSFVQSDMIIYDTLKLVIESYAKLVLGNHDMHYLTKPPFMCTGYRSDMAKPINEILESFIHRFTPCVVEDGFVITHGGVSNGLGNSLLHNSDPHAIKLRIDTEWDNYLNRRVGSSKIFNISKFRGGSHKFGGIFWADYRDEEFYGVPQIFGHSKTTGGVLQVKSHHWALGCDDNMFQCFNTVTKEVEDFGERTADAA